MPILKTCDKKKFALLLIPLFVLFSFYGLWYALLSAGLIVVLIAYVHAKKDIIVNKSYAIPTVILLLFGFIHFVILWSNLVVINRISAIVHIPALVLTAVPALVLAILSFYPAIIIVEEGIHYIRNMVAAIIKFFKDFISDFFLLGMCLLFILSSSITISQKVNYHLDEMMSYGLSNNIGGVYMTFEEGVRYSPAQEEFLSYVTADMGHRFEYDIPYENQKSDVHPPLYYFILHTICSFFPETFSKWYAGIINIVFGLLALVILNKVLILCADGKKDITYAGLPVFALSSGILNAVSFFRMYIIAMFLCLLLGYMILTAAKDNCSYRFYLRLFAVILLGALTHYYVMIYTVFLCACYGVFLVLKKRFRDILGLVLASGFAAAWAVLLFPRMLYHMFGGYRGEEALSSLTTVDVGFGGKIEALISYLDQDIWGNFLIPMTVLMLLAVVISITRKNTVSVPKMERYILLLVPSAFYCIFISWISGNFVKRYFYPIYLVLLTICIVSLYDIVRVIFRRKFIIAYSIIVVCMIVFGFIFGDREFLYKDTENLIEFAKTKKDVDCLCIYDARWNVTPEFMEIRNYGSVTFVRITDIDMLDDLEIAGDSELVLITAMLSYDDVESAVEEAFPDLTNVQEVGSYSNCTTYYLNK